jgi:hypothetical protein
VQSLNTKWHYHTKRHARMNGHFVDIWALSDVCEGETLSYGVINEQPVNKPGGSACNLLMREEVP